MSNRTWEWDKINDLKPGKEYHFDDPVVEDFRLRGKATWGSKWNAK